MSQPKGSLFTGSASDGQVSFYMRLQLPIGDSTKLMTMKIDTGAQVNTSPLSKYKKLFPHKIDDSRYPKPGSLCHTSHTWMSHDGSPKPFPGHFVTEVQHAIQPRLYPTCFYIFEDATSPQILLSYATSKRLGILEVKVSNLAASSHIDNLSVPSSPTPCSRRKTAKCVTFCDHLVHYPATQQHSLTPRP